jgi:hypothetical protein
MKRKVSALVGYRSISDFFCFQRPHNHPKHLNAEPIPRQLEAILSSTLSAEWGCTLTVLEVSTRLFKISCIERSWEGSSSATSQMLHRHDDTPCTPARTIYLNFVSVLRMPEALTYTLTMVIFLFKLNERRQNHTPLRSHQYWFDTCCANAIEVLYSNELSPDHRWFSPLYHTAGSRSPVPLHMHSNIVPHHSSFEQISPPTPAEFWPKYWAHVLSDTCSIFSSRNYLFSICQFYWSISMPFYRQLVPNAVVLRCYPPIL